MIDSKFHGSSLSSPSVLARDYLDSDHLRAFLLPVAFLFSFANSVPSKNSDLRNPILNYDCGYDLDCDCYYYAAYDFRSLVVLAGVFGENDVWKSSQCLVVVVVC